MIERRPITAKAEWLEWRKAAHEIACIAAIVQDYEAELTTAFEVTK